MVEARNLTGGSAQLNGLSFRLRNGGAYGFLEQDGAASALISMLSGALTPASGQILINGLDLQAESRRAKRQIGYVPAEPCFPDSLTVFEALRFVADLKGLSFERGIGRIAQLLESTGLEERRDTLLSALSPTEKRILGILQAVLTEPEILILEEPLSRLSQKEEKVIFDILFNLKEKRTLFVSSRRLTFLQRLCTDVFVIKEGAELIPYGGATMPPVSEETDPQNEPPAQDPKKKSRVATLFDSGKDVEIVEDEEREVR